MTDAPLRPPAVRLPIEPRIQERLVAVQRAQSRRRLKIVIAVIASVAPVAVALTITRLPVLAVQHVDVTGDVHTPRAAVLAATGLERHPQMIDLNSGRLRQKLMALPWVASAQIERHWPTTVGIHLSERVPVAEVTGPRGQRAIVDGDGRVLATLASATFAAEQRANSLPTVEGVSASGAPGTFLAGGVHAALALAVAVSAALPPASPNQLASVSISHDG
ncbi:MAG TPA: FtsQ-type POTRA domain-containing protein, partial [Acidimicrobiales bacterium]|nr:FtsQ-type POTRA domain-containing protein [Acidimicrobiales bacterium]